MRTKLTELFTTTADYETVAAGDTVFTAGESGDTMFVVKEGALTVTIDGKQVTTLGPDDIFGEMALIDKSPRSATVTATSDSVVIPLDERRFLYLVHESPYFALDVMKVMANRLRTMNQLL